MTNASKASIKDARLLGIKEAVNQRLLRIKNDKIVPLLEIMDVGLVHCDLVNNSY